MNFEETKKMAGEGALLLLLSIIPYVGWVLGIVGIILLVKSMREFSNCYHDESIYRHAWTGVKYYIVALIAVTVAVSALIIGLASASAFTITGFTNFVFTAGFGVGLAAFLGGLVVAFVFYVLAATNLRTTFNTLAEKSGDHSLAVAATLLLVGSILTIFVIGLVLIFIAWLFATIGFFSMRQYPQYPPTQPYGYTPTPPSQQPAQPAQNQTTV
jgi:uncharacterized membrane protein